MDPGQNEKWPQEAAQEGPSGVGPTKLHPTLYSLNLHQSRFFSPETAELGYRLLLQAESRVLTRDVKCSILAELSPS